jgi:hypothetical protein
MIIFTKHANDKFEVLERHGFIISRDNVIRTLKFPEIVDYRSRYPLRIAQRKVSVKYVLRVVFSKKSDIIKVITFYPKRVK